MKKDFTETEKSTIDVICSMYNIRVLAYKNGVFQGLIPKDTRITLNGTFLPQLINTSNVIYLEGKFDGMMELTIIAQ